LVNKTTSQSSTAGAEVSIESYGIHIASGTPGGGNIDRASKQLPCEDMFLIYRKQMTIPLVQRVNEAQT
jgi:hypothetical protein